MDTEVEGELLTPEEFSKDSGWQTVAVRRSGANSAPVGGISTGAKPNDNLSAKGRRDRGRAKAKIIRGGRMPQLPKEDAKIIVRPMGGLNISKRDSDTMCPNFQQNIMVVSTPCRENAIRYVRVECIAVGGQQHDVERQLPDIADRSGAPGSSRSRNPSPSVTPERSRSPSRERSRSRGRSRRRSRRRSGSRSVSRARSGSSVGQQMKRKSTLSWADRVRGGGETGPSRGPRDPLPEQARDAEIARLQKENADLKEMVRKMASEMTEIKKLVISQSTLVKASAPTAVEVPVLVSDSAGASKRRAVSSKEESDSQTNEIKGMLATLTTSVQQLHQGLAQVQVALGDPKRGLGVLSDQIDALERLVIPCTTSTTPMQVVDPNASLTIIGATSTSTHQTGGNFLRAALLTAGSRENVSIHE
ncbi:hypothetical protein HPB49_008332 [Dermacentor silvarum]|uniref:Uncharacterized protein n=1 Tax=Dermacentor silvarum TaxID=543639 RepID=A0ACB8C8E6_DERSI|nr:hypothetical protein HPB49_008332 [Dermacentor silvarum]